MIKLGARELRTTKPSEKDIKQIKKNPIYIVLDNVLDTYNVGSIFRLADAVSAEKVILCGETETPPHTRIKKASINTTEWIDWEYCSSAIGAIKKLPEEFSIFLEQYSSRETRAYRGTNREVQIIAIEQSSKSVPYDQVQYQFPIALVVGNETRGVAKEVLEISDAIVEIPMWGVNKSLNVMVSLGIVLYEAMKHKKS